jgi:uncharacterized protein with HEPN domain
MQADIKDAARLNDMMTAAGAAYYFIVDLDEDANEGHYNANLLLQSAVERQIEIMAGAAHKVSDGFKDVHPEIPWKKISAIRHILSHDYGMINNDIIWRIVTVYIPELFILLAPLIPPPSP